MTKYIAYSVDTNQYLLTIVSMSSILINSQDEIFEFIILYDNLTKKIIEELKSVTAIKFCKFRFIKVNPEIFKQFPLAGWVTVQAWYRILIPSLCKDLDKCLYLDNDTLILKSLDELYETDISRYLAGCVEDCCQKRWKKNLSMENEIYFNSGIILINAKKWREVNLFEKIKQFAIENKQNIKASDQDCLNVIINKDKVILSPKYNLMENEWRGYDIEYEGEMLKEYYEALENPVIIHFTGAKPFTLQSGHKYKKIWWQYASKTKVFHKIMYYFFLSILELLFCVKINSGKNVYIKIFGIKIKFKINN